MTYSESIDALIPEAEKIANERVRQIGKKWNPRKGTDGKIYRFDYFSREFHNAMNELAKAKGLRNIPLDKLT
uniref:Uncharacterized protein n=1 Tax=viral metagenome TaxID=1070528 RepID=A0A6M3JKS9_9ZZZZ